MAVKVIDRNGWLSYRVYFDGIDSREPTGLRATPKNREKLERRAQTMSDLMADGKFRYLDHFPDGNEAHRFRPAAPPTPPKAQTIGDYAEQMWLRRSVPPLVRASLAKTRSKHLRCHIVPALGELRLDALDPAALEDFRASLTRSVADGGKGLKMKTARDIIDSTLRALLRDARTLDYRTAFGASAPIGSDPFATLRWPRVMLPEPDPFSGNERDQILDGFATRKPHYHTFIAVLFLSGLRIAEAIGLRWSDVDLRRGSVRIRRSRTLGEDNAPKTRGAERTIPLVPAVVAVLRRVQPLRATENTFVFTSEAGLPLDGDRFVEKHWRPVLRACNVRHRKLYATRHTFISLALEKGASIKPLADYCGTSVEMIERHYARWMGGDEALLRLLAEPTEVRRSRRGVAA